MLLVFSQLNSNISGAQKFSAGSKNFQPQWFYNANCL